MSRASLQIQRNCVVRDFPCGRIFSGSNTCFVACPSSDEVGFEIEIIKSVLKDEDIEPYIAVENFEPARDLFCTKVCTKIIEAKFCIVLLTGVANGGKTVVPNPNVYYEYGLMTSWRKCIVPLQMSDQNLAFNIQSLDTVKYTPSTFKKSLSSSVRIALSSLEDVEEDGKGKLVEDTLALYLELNGFSPHKKAWSVNKTNYMPFELFNFGRVVYSAADVDLAFFETKVIVRRLERFISDLDVKIAGVRKSHAKANTDAQKKGTLKELGKLEKQHKRATTPRFTIMVLQADIKQLVAERTTVRDTTLIPEVRVLTYEEMEMELKNL